MITKMKRNLTLYGKRLNSAFSVFIFYSIAIDVPRAFLERVPGTRDLNAPELISSPANKKMVISPSLTMMTNGCPIILNFVQAK